MAFEFLAGENNLYGMRVYRENLGEQNLYGNFLYEERSGGRDLNNYHYLTKPLTVYTSVNTR